MRWTRNRAGLRRAGGVMLALVLGAPAAGQGPAASLPARTPGAATRPATLPTTADGIPILRFGVVAPPVVAQADVTVQAPESIRQAQPVPLELSGMCWIEGHLVLVGDEHKASVFVIPMDPARPAITPPRPVVVVPDESQALNDLEAITARQAPDGTWIVHLLCSLSNSKKEATTPNRRRMGRLKVDPRTGVVERSAEVLDARAIREVLERSFQERRIAPYREFNADSSTNTNRWGNVEGLAVTPDGGRWLCGLRNPLRGEHALVVVLEGVEHAFGYADPEPLAIAEVFELPLGGRGIADLAWDPVTRGYLIVAGRSDGPKLDPNQVYPPPSRDSAVYWWNGARDGAPLLVAVAPDMNLEAICRVGQSRWVAIGSDDELGETGRRQSVLTLVDWAALVTAGRKAR